MSARPVIMGELGLLSLFDLAQLLLLNGASGLLHVSSEGRKGWLRFDRGQITDALDANASEALDAACAVFAWRHGTFEFRAGKPSGDGRRIHQATEGLMLEAARRMDEAGLGHAEDNATRALLERTGLWATLRATTTHANATHANLPSSTDARLRALESGLILVGAPGIRAAETLLQSTVASLRAERDVTVMLTAEKAFAPQADARGSLQHVARRRFMTSLAMTSPAVVVLDCAHADLAAAALASGALVIVSVVAADAVSLIPTWVARHGLDDATHDIGVRFQSDRTTEPTALHVVVTPTRDASDDLRAAA